MPPRRDAGDPGADGLHGTGDDSVSSFDTRGFQNLDAEDVTFDTVIVPICGAVVSGASGPSGSQAVPFIKVAF